MNFKSKISDSQGQTEKAERKQELHVEFNFFHYPDL
jgi:hypothetical protein